jgi:hypothetical protein
MAFTLCAPGAERSSLPQAPQKLSPAPQLPRGILRINSIPKSTMFLDERELGPPRDSVSVSRGEHKVQFVNKKSGLSKTITVSVGPGETKLAVAKLD